MVLGSGARLLGIGIVVGLAASLASVKVLSGLVTKCLDVRPVFVRRGDRAAVGRRPLRQLLAGPPRRARGPADSPAKRLTLRCAILVPKEANPYSYRNASIGSIAAARRAGTEHASAATASSNNVTPPRMMGSRAL